MNKNKFLTLLCIGLLLSNLLLVGFILFRKPPRHAMRGPKEIISQRLNFDESQKAAFQKMIKGHQSKMREHGQAIFKSKNALYAGLNSGLDPEKKDSLLALIAQNQKDIERLHFQHFQDIKALCKENQLKAFEELTQDLAKLFSPRPKPPRD